MSLEKIVEMGWFNRGKEGRKEEPADPGRRKFLKDLWEEQLQQVL
jgi:hypothetical protein